jgi:carbonic anhydrase
MITGKEALQRLKEGNVRFVAGVKGETPIPVHDRREELARGQAPFATILGCSDSRAPVELVFDQGLGDLFVIRVAGNIVAPSLVGSVEFATARFGTPLVVVLGHTGCGAIAATLEDLTGKGERSPNLRSIVDRIKPSVLDLMETDLRAKPAELAAQAVRANIRVSTNYLRHASDILEDAVRRGQLMIVGAEYSLETGVVDFFDMPA